MDAFTLGDTPKNQDLLGYRQYANVMARILTNPNLETPFAVGIYGPWGTGKSTFMVLLDAALQNEIEDDEYHGVMFQPWQFEEKEEVWKALLFTVIQHLDKTVADARGGSAEIEEQLDRIQGTLLNLTVKIGKLALDRVITHFTGNQLSLNDVLEAYAETSRDNSHFINTFREEFRQVRDELFQITGVGFKRLFIFVDDLDRCTPENCVMVLEAIKLFFDLEECVFVVGIDQEVVQNGIDAKYKDGLGIRGKDYLDKMIQLPFVLPVVSGERFQQFAHAATSNLSLSSNVVALLTEAADSNPRRLKRMANSIQMIMSVAQENPDQMALKQIGEKEPDPLKVAFLLTLQVRFPTVFRWLVARPVTRERLAKYWDLAGASEDERTRMERGGLIAFLKTRGDNQTSAEITADRFFEFWNKAEQNLELPPFNSVEELTGYLGMTGVVNESENPDSKDQDARTLRKLLDERVFLGDASEESKSGKTDKQKTEQALETNTGETLGTLGTQTSKVQVFRDDWNNLQRSLGPISSFLRVRRRLMTIRQMKRRSQTLRNALRKMAPGVDKEELLDDMEVRRPNDLYTPLLLTNLVTSGVSSALSFLAIPHILENWYFRDIFVNDTGESAGGDLHYLRNWQVSESFYELSNIALTLTQYLLYPIIAFAFINLFFIAIELLMREPSAQTETNGA